jgi:hypothetical protein
MFSLLDHLGAFPHAKVQRTGFRFPPQLSRLALSATSIRSKCHESVMSLVMNGERLHLEKITSMMKVTEVWLSACLDKLRGEMISPYQLRLRRLEPRRGWWICAP